MIVDKVRLLLEKKVSEDPPVYRFAHFDRLFVKELLQAYDELNAECSRVREENEFLHAHISVAEQDAQAGFDSLNQTFTEVVQENKRLRALEARVKNGKLTEEEFQATCHNLSPKDEERFMRGCHVLWQQLFRGVGGRRVAEVLGIKPEDVLGG